MSASDWISIVGTVASLGGLLLSWMAWAQAKKAKEAAEEAAQVVRRRERAYEFSQLARDAKELIVAIQNSSEDLAVHIATGLMHEIDVFVGHSTENPTEAQKLRSLVKLLQKNAILIKVYGVPDPGPDLEALFNACHHIHDAVCEISGKLERRSED